MLLPVYPNPILLYMYQSHILLRIFQLHTPKYLPVTSISLPIPYFFSLPIPCTNISPSPILCYISPSSILVHISQSYDMVHIPFPKSYISPIPFSYISPIPNSIICLLYISLSLTFCHVCPQSYVPTYPNPLLLHISRCHDVTYPSPIWYIYPSLILLHISHSHCYVSHLHNVTHPNPILYIVTSPNPIFLQSSQSYCRKSSSSILVYVSQSHDITYPNPKVTNFSVLS